MSYNVGSQGTYLDTILPRADLAENQAAMPEIGEKYHHSSHFSPSHFNCILMKASEWGWAKEISCRPQPCTSARGVAELTRYYTSYTKIHKKYRKAEKLLFLVRTRQPSSGLRSTARSTRRPRGLSRWASRRATSASGASWPRTARRSSSTSPASTSPPPPTATWTTSRWGVFKISWTS